MQHVGDITRLSGYELEIPDVVTGGSPCQGLSVAGKGKGLADERSGLFMEQIRLIKELRDASAARADEYIRPRYMVWENVGGATSSNGGEDFRIVLEETARIVCEDAVIPRPEKGKWRNAGCIMGDGWSIAWRIHDAQFWGVPQRRRRIALVADFGGQSAPEILFERKGLLGDTAPRGEAGQVAAADAERGANPTVARSLTARADGSPCIDRGPNIVVSEVARAVRARPGASFQEDSDALICMATQQGGAEIRCDDMAPTLTAAAGMSGNNQPVICRAAGFNGHKSVSGSIQYGEECAPTIEANMPPNVSIAFACNQRDEVRDLNDIAGAIQAQPGMKQQTFVAGFKAGQGEKAGGIGWQNEISPTLAAAPSGTNMIPVVMAHGQANAEITEGVSPTLNCNHEQPIVASIDCRNGAENGDLCGTLQAHDKGGYSLNCTHPVRINHYVRRLTPLECERLQGYPGGWTDIPDYTFVGKKRTASDSARYKALGNSIALPFWKWLLKRISAQYERDATLGSLFDGLGGFPYLWEQINGKGSALWASEIEPFCIAVTEYRINGRTL